MTSLTHECLKGFGFNSQPCEQVFIPDCIIEQQENIGQVYILCDDSLEDDYFEYLSPEFKLYQIISPSQASEV